MNEYLLVIVTVLGVALVWLAWRTTVHLHHLYQEIVEIEVRLNKLDPDSREEFIDNMMTAMETSIAKHTLDAVREQFGTIS